MPGTSSAFASFTAAGTTSDEGFEALHFVVDVPDVTPASLSRAVQAWTDALGRKGAKSLLADPELRDSDPWFGFGVRCGETLLGEASLMEKLEGADPAPVESFVRAVIAFNKKHADDLEGPLFTHEELETGSDAVKWLVLRDLRQLDLYLDFLATLDLDHTVAQVDTVFALAKRYTPAQLAPLARWVKKHSAQLLDDWLSDDRAWKEKLPP